MRGLSISTAHGRPTPRFISCPHRWPFVFLINGGAVTVTGGKPTVANTVMSSIFGQGGNDTITLNETNGALPAAQIFGGMGNDVITGGWPVLGLPPVWYKAAPYRSRAVIDPRSVLADFGLTLPAETEIKVWDSTSEVRYLVLPQRPEGTDGWSEERLATLVTRDSMIGTGLARSPSEAP